MEKIAVDGGLIVVTRPGTGEYDNSLLPADLSYIDGLGSSGRRAEAAAWRALVRMEMGDVDISYTDVGAPVVRGSGKWTHISVSHTVDLVAVLFSTSPCAIDIERTDRNFSPASSRFVSAEESRLSDSGEVLFLPAMWCAKETLYKLSGRKGLDLLGDLRVSMLDIENNIIHGSVKSGDGHWQEYKMNMLRYDENIIMVYAN